MFSPSFFEYQAGWLPSTRTHSFILPTFRQARDPTYSGLLANLSIFCGQLAETPFLSDEPYINTACSDRTDLGRYQVARVKNARAG